MAGGARGLGRRDASPCLTVVPLLDLRAGSVTPLVPLRPPTQSHPITRVHQGWDL